MNFGDNEKNNGRKDFFPAEDLEKTVIEKAEFHHSPAKLFCPACGKQLLPDAKFCKYCGTPVGERNNKGSGQAAGKNEKKSYSKKNNRTQGVQKKLDSVWPGWKVDRLLGEGAFGKVYRIARTDGLGYQFESALKIISIPSSQQEIRRVISAGMDESAATAYFKSMVEEMVAEIVLMSQLKGITNIVSYEDHAILKDEKQIRWDIFIRMEYLTPLFEYTGSRIFTVRDALKLGIDMCNALEVCEKYHIIHRDIKPENIFVSDVGNYKLGDFGIARQLEKTSLMYSKKGTPSYMAPEVNKGEEYNSTVDIYSLGMVLYHLLNNNRGPFMPPYPEKIRYSDSEEALISRLKGESLPMPCRAGEELGRIILKACSYQPEERYKNAAQFREALMSVLNIVDFDKEYPPVNILPEKNEEVSRSLNLDEDIQPSSDDSADKDGFEPDGFRPDHFVRDNAEEDGFRRDRFKTDSSGQAGQEDFHHRNHLYDDNIHNRNRRHKEKQPPYKIAIILAGVTIVVLLAIIFMLLIKKTGEKKKKAETTQAETTREESADTSGEDVTQESTLEKEEEKGPFLVAMEYKNNAELDPVEYDGHAYAVFNFIEDLNLTSYEACEQYCENMGGHLATIDNQEENDFLYYDYLRKNGKKTAMFGYSNDNSRGEWQWVDGVSRGFLNWSQMGNQPNNKSGHEHYAEFYKESEDGKWNDAGFGVNTYRMICEWE
ncbi:MAG: protein kinase [Eubacterium sp.]|nr:protein kinase [Eubacterium sp.]